MRVLFTDNPTDPSKGPSVFGVDAIVVYKPNPDDRDASADYA